MSQLKLPDIYADKSSTTLVLLLSPDEHNCMMCDSMPVTSEIPEIHMELSGGDACSCIQSQSC